jgi:hypothetical protein
VCFGGEDRARENWTAWRCLFFFYKGEPGTEYLNRVCQSFGESSRKVSQGPKTRRGGRRRKGVRQAQQSRKNYLSVGQSVNSRSYLK